VPNNIVHLNRHSKYLNNSRYNHLLFKNYSSNSLKYTAETTHITPLFQNRSNSKYIHSLFKNYNSLRDAPEGIQVSAFAGQLASSPLEAFLGFEELGKYIPWWFALLFFTIYCGGVLVIICATITGFWCWGKKIYRYFKPIEEKIEDKN